MECGSWKFDPNPQFCVFGHCSGTCLQMWRTLTTQTLDKVACSQPCDSRNLWLLLYISMTSTRGAYRIQRDSTRRRLIECLWRLAAGEVQVQSSRHGTPDLKKHGPQAEQRWKRGGPGRRKGTYSFAAVINRNVNIWGR